MSAPLAPQEVLQKYWGYPAFRPLQEDIIQATLAGKDVLALLPTGGGKSVCYQVPGLCQEGVCLVISPLIALMKDQVQQLQTRNLPASAVHTGLSSREIDDRLNQALMGTLKFLYLSPERLHTELFQARFQAMPINLIAIDEAHCISQWGHDFRPAYLQIARLRESRPEIPFLALTASATPEVQADIKQFLELKNPEHFEKSFARENLTFAVREVEDKETKLYQVLQHLKGSGLVYCRTRKNTMRVAEILSKKGLKADYYHAGLEAEQRSQKQEDWINDRIQIMACTNAFGMGIDKPDVRFVIHWDMPDSLEAYYQEAGRAGRDGKHSFAVLLYQQHDIDDLKAWKANNWPLEREIRMVYQGLANQYGLAFGSQPMDGLPFDLESFAKKVNLQSPKVFQALKKLQEEGYIQLNDSFAQLSRFRFTVHKQQLYEAQIKHAHIDGISKILLRVYGGELFENYIDIKEEILAQALFISVNEVKKLLLWLHEARIAKYQMRSDKPKLIYLRPRQDAAKMTLNIKALEARRQREEQRLETMEKYAQGKYLCRSLYMQHYFGEKTLEACGQCDKCKNRKARGKASFDLHKLLKTIRHQPVLPSDLKAKIPAHLEEDLISGIKLLLEQGVVSYDEAGRLCAKA